MNSYSASKHLSFAAGILLLAGCGGSGNAPISPAPGSLKANVARAIAGGFNAKAAGQSQGGEAKRIARRDGDATPFDSFYELYIQDTSTDALNYRINYFLDQALTQPAGYQSKSSTFSGDKGFSSHGSIRITAGPRAGYNAEITTTYASSRLEFSFQGTDPNVGSFNASGVFQDGAGEYRTADTDLQGVTREYIASYAADGTSRVEYDSPTSFRYTLNYAADQSGTGTVTGNSPLLPATVQWNSEGTGDITFADGTKISFKHFNFNQI